MNEYEYDGRNYVLVNDRGTTRHIIGPTVAIVFDKDDGVLFKHGVPSLVNDWAERTRRTLRKYGSDIGVSADMAIAITVIEGPIPIPELNKIISVTGYIGTYYRNMMSTSMPGENINVVV